MLIQTERQREARERDLWESPSRIAWLKKRLHFETTGERCNPERSFKLARIQWMKFLIRLCNPFLFITGILRRGRSNARAIQLTEVSLPCPKLPKAFDGFTLLHLTDLHVDRMPEVIPEILKLVEKRSFDLVVLTGDYRDSAKMIPDQIAPGMRLLFKELKSEHGILAVLGNHDSHAYAHALEDWGARVLLNESVQIFKQSQSIWVTGTDDVHHFFTPNAPKALSETPPGDFKIALVHSAELHEQASTYGYSLYLCGHTHGGQICLPGGIPVQTRQNTPRKFSSGLWQHGHLSGYTSRGAGVVAMEARFNCPGEVVAITLRAETGAHG